MNAKAIMIKNRRSKRNWLREEGTAQSAKSGLILFSRSILAWKVSNSCTLPADIKGIGLRHLKTAGEYC